MLRSGCYLRVGVIGINYKTADLALREAFARITARISGERALFFNHPTVLLSTCNRTEIYFSNEDLAEAHSDLLSFFRLYINEPFEHRLYAYFGIDCFFHLSRVASGLDSAILAETEIQAQVRLAYSRASQVSKLPSCIHYIFQKSLRVAKHTRNTFSLEKGAATLYGTIWQMAEEHFADIKKMRILLVGYSEINRGLGSFLLRRGIQRFFIVTRHPSEIFMEGAIAKGREFLDSWYDFDLIICATKTEEYLIQGKGAGHHLIFDLSVPRVVDPQLHGALLFNIEQLDKFIEKNRRLVAEEVERVEERVQEYVRRLSRIYRSKNERAKLLYA